VTADKHRVPFNRPSMVGRELEYIEAAVRQGQLAGDGPFTRRCQQWLERQCGATRVLLTHSGTAALELAALLCEVGPGDEVVMPSFTFVSTANAFVLRGARPVFVDIREDTLNLDEGRIEHALSDRSRALVPVHYAGVACEMDAILALARERGLLVVEDAAQGLGATYRDHHLGTLGDLGCWSFHETKNILTGEGGALVISAARLSARAEILREKGTDRARFLRGEVDKYTWVDVGSSYLPSEIIAAYLFAQLEHWQEVLARRRAICERYAGELAPLAAAGSFRLPVVPGACRHNGHMFYMLLADQALRDRLLQHLNAAGINAVFHYVPLHSSPMGRRLGYAPSDLPITESVSRRLVRLPCFFSLTDEQQSVVIGEVRRFFCRA
jgi:dTDP-4-amino-4,6-dideoxygalactose transaminase